LSRDLGPFTIDIQSRYNIAPGQDALATFQEIGRSPELRPMTWGPTLIRERAGSPCAINVKAESIAHQPSLRTAFKSRRCLVPATGFYQWTRSRSGRVTPYYFRPAKADESMAFAGLWEPHPGGSGQKRSFAVITTAADDSVSPVHERMPVTIPRVHWRQWLDPGGHDYFGLLTMLLPTMSIGLYGWKVGEHVNDAGVDCEKCIARVA
jgi:putative SOS response-associated peptidase YedK